MVADVRGIDALHAHLTDAVAGHHQFVDAGSAAEAGLAAGFRPGRASPGRWSAKVEDQPGVDDAFLNLFEGLVDVVELTGLAHDSGAAVGVELEGLG